MEPANPPQQNSTSQARLARLTGLIPTLTNWLGDINGLTTSLFNRSAEAKRIWDNPKDQSKSLATYLDDVIRYPDSSNENKTEFDVLHSDVIEPNKNLVKEKSARYIQNLVSELSRLYELDFRPEEKTSPELIHEYTRELQFFTREILPRFNTVKPLEDFSAYPAFLKKLLTLIDLALRIIEALKQSESEKELEAKRTESDTKEKLSDSSALGGSPLLASVTAPQSSEEASDIRSVAEAKKDAFDRLEEVRRQGQGVIYSNKKPATWEEIRQQLARAGIDEKTYPKLLPDLEGIFNTHAKENWGGIPTSSNPPSQTAKPSKLDHYESVQDFLKDRDRKTEIQLFLKKLDSVAFAAQVATFAGNNSALSQDVLNHAIEVLAQQNPNFAISLRSSPTFNQEATTLLLQKIQAAKAYTFAVKGRFFGINSAQAKNPKLAFDAILAITESLGGGVIAANVLQLSKPELKEKARALKSGSFSGTPSPTNTSAEAKPQTPTSPNSDASTKIDTGIARAQYLLWESARLSQNPQAQQSFMTLDAFKKLALPTSGKATKTQDAALTAMYYEVFRELDQGTFSYEQDQHATEMEAAVVSYEEFEKLVPMEGAESLGERVFVSFEPEESSQIFYSEDGTAIPPGMESRVTPHDPDLIGPPQRIGGRVRSLRKRNKQAQNLMKAGKNARFFTNPAIGGLAGAGGAALLGFATQGIAGGLGAGTFGLAGGLAGAWAGASAGAIFGPIGAVVGGIGGGLIGGFGAGAASLSVEIGGQSLAQVVGNAEMSLLNGGATPAISNAGSSIATGVGTNANSLLGQAGSLATKAAGNGVANLSSLVQMMSNVPITAPVGVIIPAGLGIVATITIVISAVVVPGAFLIPGKPDQQCSAHICVEKNPNPEFAEDPIAVVYTVRITPVDPDKNITITGVTDTMSVTFAEDKDPKPQPKTVPAESLAGLQGSLGAEKTIDYTVDFGPEYDDTRITNTITVAYEVDGTEDTFQAQAAVTFGQPPATGCWPVSGALTQLPFTGSGTHKDKDSYDIAAPIGTAIQAPYSGTLLVFTEGEAGDDWLGAGNFVVLQSDIGYDFLFEHLSEVPPEGPVNAGDIIGEVGSTGNSTGPHLHYEIRRRWNQPAAGPPSLLATVVPADLTGDPNVHEIGDEVSSSTCGEGSATETTVREGCFVFDSSNKPWTEGEIEKVRTVLKNEILNDPKVERLVCTNGFTPQDVRLTRTEDACTDPGAGDWSGYTSSASSIDFCDNLFDGDFNRSRFGRSTILHEPAHLIQLRHPFRYDTALQSVDPTGTLFPKSGSFYTDTYPYKYEQQTNPPLTQGEIDIKIPPENFGEAFGLCRGIQNRFSEGLGYRGKYASTTGQAEALNKYSAECAAMRSIIDQMTQ